MSKLSKIVGFVAITISLLVFIAMLLSFTPYVLVHFTPGIPEAYSDVFPQQVDEGVELNQGLQLRPHPGKWMMGTYCILDIINSSNEPIDFNKSKFNTVVYWPDKKSGKWSILSRWHYGYPVNRNTIPLPQKAEEQITPVDTLMISADDFEWIPNSQLRFYIEGIGAITNKTYGAYIDIALKKPLFR